MQTVKDRRETNPLYNDRKLKLGTFSTNLAFAGALTTVDGTHNATWPDVLELARLADDMEFEAIVPVARWRGFGGLTNAAGPGFETFTWAAGVGAATTYPCIFATSHVPLTHPITAAKQMAVIDHITGGRTCLNVVTGWNRPEIEMFGVDLIEHDDRYDMAEEWLTIIDRLWTEDEEFDHQGEYFTINRGYLEPKPIQTPRPVVMNAGGSDRGRHYAAKFADVSFVPPKSREYAVLKDMVSSYYGLGRNEYDNELQMWTNCYVVQGETEQEARDKLRYYIHEKGDWEAGGRLVETMGINAETFTDEEMVGMKAHFMAGWGGFPLVGTKEQIVDKMIKLTDCGFNGLLLTWIKFEEEMREFMTQTYPLLQQAGVR
ncbi:MAG: LLM class flavin-dependent oxidoreductase [Pseudomonadota bacterium]|nr:LLM class flavin-dependent oxidoreductase [Pseudomonadota bacterium]